VVAALDLQPGAGRNVLVVVAHADDVALFIGGTVAAWSDAGYRVVVVRVTDDRWDSVGLNEADTIAANLVEFHKAADILGVAEIVELGEPTDVLADISEVRLREMIIRQIRVHRPYALVTFDPYAMYGEDNQDHHKVAAATDEAFWTAQFDKHHPEHLAEGLQPHGCFERWYFGRSVQHVTDVVDITATLDRKVAAACAHATMMGNFISQLQMQAHTGGWRIDAVDQALAAGDLDPLLAQLVRAGSAQVGARHELDAAEEFRVVRFGGMQALLDAFGTRI
jgi:LmbE family N-acetylglucosaminyl deacetylase